MSFFEAKRELPKSISQSICPGGHFKMAGIAVGVRVRLLLDAIAVVTSNSSPRIWEESG